MLQKIKKGFKEGKFLLLFGSLSAAGQGLGMIAPLVVAKFFEPELFGSYSLAKMMVFFFSTLLVASTQMPFIVFANQEKIKTGRINKSFSVQCVFLLLSFCIFLVTILLLNRYIIKFTQINCGDLLFLILAFFGLALKTFLGNLFMAMGQRIKNSLVELTFGLLSLIFIFILYFTDRINLRTVFLVYPISTGIVSIIFLKMINFKLLFPFVIEKEYLRKMFNFTKWVFLGATAVYFVNWGDNLVLRYFVSMEDIGIYNLGYQFFKGIITFGSISSFYFLPFISQNINNLPKIRGYLYNKRPKIFAAGTIAIVIIFFLFPFAFDMLYNDVYHGSINVLRILLVGAIFSLYNTFYNIIYNVAKRYKFIYILSIIQVLINILLNVFLVPVMGIKGAAIATVLAYFFKTIVLELHFWIYMRKYLHI